MLLTISWVIETVFHYFLIFFPRYVFLHIFVVLAKAENRCCSKGTER